MGGRAVSAPRVITNIGRALVDKELALAATARSFLALIDERLSNLKDERRTRNSDEGQRRCSAEIADFEDLKKKIEDFLDKQAGFSAGSASEKQLVGSTTSLV
jgi:hypothetical protein